MTADRRHAYIATAILAIVWPLCIVWGDHFPRDAPWPGLVLAATLVGVKIWALLRG